MQRIPTEKYNELYIEFRQAYGDPDIQEEETETGTTWTVSFDGIEMLRSKRNIKGQESFYSF